MKRFEMPTSLWTQKKYIRGDGDHTPHFGWLVIDLVTLIFLGFFLILIFCVSVWRSVKTPCWRLATTVADVSVSSGDESWHQTAHSLWTLQWDKYTIHLALVRARSQQHCRHRVAEVRFHNYQVRLRIICGKWEWELLHTDGKFVAKSCGLYFTRVKEELSCPFDETLKWSVTY